MKENRIEADSLGNVKVPSDRYFGAQTQRSIKNFAIGSEKMPLAVIYAIVHIKKAAAKTHLTLKLLTTEKSGAIEQACDEILQGQHDQEFPLAVWQSGSGTQSHMNVNEVIANRSNELLGEEKGSNKPVHPNDDVNKSQSTNDVVSSAVQLAALSAVKQQLLPALNLLINTLTTKTKQFSKTITIGRTHMGDAVPMYLGQRFSAYVDQLQDCVTAIENTTSSLAAIPLGGTAIGNSINLPEHYIESMIEYLKEAIDPDISSADNFFARQASLDVLVETSAHLNTLACVLIKIANDIRLMSSGPRCGFNEISLPVNEPGSSIMPGKINPTQCEALIMVATRVQGNHVTITNANSLINFEAHGFRPVIIYSLLQSLQLLSDAITSFSERCVSGIEAKEETLQKNVESSLALATVLNTKLGYEKAGKIAKTAFAENLTLKQAALKLDFLTEAECDEFLNPDNML